jgi:hypothetical protein
MRNAYKSSIDMREGKENVDTQAHVGKYCSKKIFETMVHTAFDTARPTDRFL